MERLERQQAQLELDALRDARERERTLLATKQFKQSSLAVISVWQAARTG